MNSGPDYNETNLQYPESQLNYQYFSILKMTDFILFYFTSDETYLDSDFRLDQLPDIS